MDWLSVGEIYHRLFRTLLVFDFTMHLHPANYTDHFLSTCLNFGSKHCKRSLLDILSNLVPGIEFDGRLGESDEFDSLKH
jgi:hypothetical protein